MDERYHRQGLIKGWRQEKINEASVNLIGSGRLSDFILVDLLSLGIGNIIRIGSSDFFEFGKINPEVYFESLEETLSSLQNAEFLIDRDVVIDATNSLFSKQLSSAVSKNKGLVYLSASAGKSGFSFCMDKFEEDLIDFHQNDNYREQGNISSMICGAVITDELRKKIMPLSGDYPQTNFKYSGIDESCSLEKRVIQIGAGAVGTFTALGLALLGVELTLIDFDSVEETNLNRQFLFYNSVGLSKSEVLANRLARYTKKIRGINYKVEKDFNPEGFDVIFSCVDNNRARYFINQASIRYRVPLINGGSSIKAGHAMPFFPGKTACLDCQLGFKLSQSVGEEKRSSGECFHPSLVIPNQIVGGMMLGCYLKALNCNYEKSIFSSGEGIYDQKVNKECFGSCNCT